MKRLFILMIPFALLSGCSSNQLLSDEKVQQSIVDEFKPKNVAGQPTKFGESCSYSEGSCSTQLRSVGLACSCMTTDGIQSGTVR